MTAFASNSLLNRIGVAGYGMDPLDFAAVRTGAGAVMLWALVLPRRAPYPPMRTGRRLAGAVALTVYMLGFSWAYISLDAGLGALILFGVLQIVIFGWAVIGGQHVPALRWLGAVIALIGLCILLWPSGAAAVPMDGAIAMSISAVGWAAYTLLGRGETDALGATAGNFLLCLPFVLVGMGFASSHPMSLPGVLVAIIAGAVTSGLGYALWYRVLPGLPSTMAGIAQLSVPVIAVAAGVLVLNEPLTQRLLVASALVLSGIGVSLLARR